MANHHRRSPSPSGSGAASVSSKRDAVRETKSNARTPRLNLSWTILVGVVVLLVAGGIYVAERNRPTTTTPTSEGAVPAAPVVREDSHRLATASDNKVTLVEFLDFECEACGAVYPTIEQLRTQYDSRVTFVARYFPLDGHFNAMRAARAVEAAAQQDQFEAMYKRMYETQESWGEQQVALDGLFRSYAVDLGLDMEQWDTAYDDPATLARIQTDIADGTALGVTGTPSFFLNGQPFTPQSVDDLTNALDEALAQ